MCLYSKGILGYNFRFLYCLCQVLIFGLYWFYIMDWAVIFLPLKSWLRLTIFIIYLIEFAIKALWVFFGEYFLINSIPLLETGCLDFPFLLVLILSCLFKKCMFHPGCWICWYSIFLIILLMVLNSEVIAAFIVDTGDQSV